MADSDWDTVTVLRKKAAKASVLKSESAVAAARRTGGDVETSKKFGGGGNKQHGAVADTAKLDRETEELHHDTLALEVGKVIQQARVAKGLKQKDLAVKINEREQVVQEYESSRCIPNPQILQKMERVLGVKLRGKDIGTPLAPRGSSAK